LLSAGRPAARGDTFVTFFRRHLHLLERSSSPARASILTSRIEFSRDLLLESWKKKKKKKKKTKKKKTNKKKNSVDRYTQRLSRWGFRALCHPWIPAKKVTRYG